MIQRFGLLFACFWILGCNKNATDGLATNVRTPRSVWTAVMDNGDKPGIGIRLTEISNKIQAVVFLLDANKPGNLDAGKACPTDIVTFDKSNMQLRVQFSPQFTDNFVLHFDSPLVGPKVDAVIQDIPDSGQKRMLTFLRQ